MLLGNSFGRSIIVLVRTYNALTTAGKILFPGYLNDEK